MLVLSRKQGEVVVIGDNIRLTVAAIRGKQVRLGISAPLHVEVYREELGTKSGVVDILETHETGAIADGYRGS